MYSPSSAYERSVGERSNRSLNVATRTLARLTIGAQERLTPRPPSS
jgi:hypothetical protein